MSHGTYRLKVSLTDLRPKVLRTVEVPADVSLHQLHMILQLAMGWERRHMYMFDVDGTRYGLPEVQHRGELLSALEVSLDDLGLQSGDRFTYEYDFDSVWRHTVKVRGRADKETPVPTCTEGHGACPPEESGGVFRYRRMIRAMNDPDDPDSTELTEEMGDDFDPEYFDSNVANQELAWYWEHRDVLPSERAIDRVLEAFLQDMEFDVGRNTWQRYQRDLRKVTAFLNEVGPQMFPVDHYLLEESEFAFTEVADIAPMLLSIDSFFVYHLLWKLVAPITTIKDCRATIRRLIRWLHEYDLIDDALAEACQREALMVARWVIEFVEQSWLNLEHPELEEDGESWVERGGRQVYDVDSEELQLIDPYTGRQMEKVRVPEYFAGRIQPGAFIGAELRTTSRGTFLTGALVLDEE